MTRPVLWPNGPNGHGGAVVFPVDLDPTDGVVAITVDDALALVDTIERQRLQIAGLERIVSVLGVMVVLTVVPAIAAGLVLLYLLTR